MERSVSGPERLDDAGLPVAAGSPAPLIEVRDLSKEFPGVRALDAVSMTILAGEVHALVGENGAGKSTLVKLLSGVEQPDGGEMLLNGQPYVARGPQDALAAGIRVVYQELNLLTYLTIEENLSFEHLPSHRGLVDRRELRRRAEELLEEVGLDVPPDTPVEELGIAQMQMVEIARALLTDAKLLILDEPTATLTPREVDRLFEIIRQLTAQGIGVLFISHHLDEMKEIGDRVTVLRNGQWAATRDVADVTVAEVIELMVGRAMAEGFPFREQVVLGEELLTVDGLTYRGNVEPVSLRVHAGEILGIAGLVGSGRTEAMRAIFGADRATGGDAARPRSRRSDIREPRDAVRAGICLLTEDRKSQGLILDMTCAQNTTITRLDAVVQRGLLQAAREAAETEALIDALSIKAQSPSPGRALPLGRQPAEGRRRQVALRRLADPHLRRAHARHRRGRQVRDLQPHLGSGRSAARASSSSPPTCPSCWASATASWSSPRARSWASCPARTSARRPSWSWPTATTWTRRRPPRGPR